MHWSFDGTNQRAAMRRQHMARLWPGLKNRQRNRRGIRRAELTAVDMYSQAGSMHVLRNHRVVSSEILLPLTFVKRARAADAVRARA